MTDYRIELQAFVDAAASFTEPALGHHKAWAEAVARARVALSAPESSTNSACPITPPPELAEKWALMFETHTDTEVFAEVTRWGADQELEACCKLLELSDSNAREFLTAARRPRQLSLKEQALAALQEAAYMADDSPPQGICADQIDIIRRALEALPE